MNASDEATVDNFALVRELGEGVSGRVYLARNRRTGEAFALKLLERGDEPEYAEKLKTYYVEQRFLARLDHPNIIKFHAFCAKGVLSENGRQRSVSYIVTELARRGEIFDVLYHYGAFDCNTTRFYAKQLLEALAHIHSEGKAHRDVKPENLLLDADFTLKLADFGFACEPPADRLNATQLGTPGYMSPELLAGDAYDARKADVWAAGMVVFIFFTGRLPFNAAGDVYFQLYRNDRDRFWAEQARLPPRRPFPSALRALLERMLEPDFVRRASAAEALAAPWLCEPCDAAAARAQMHAYNERTMAAVSLSHETNRPPSLENTRAAAGVSWFEEFEVSRGEAESRCLTFETADVRAALDELRAALSDGTTAFKRERGTVVVSSSDSHGAATGQLRVVQIGERTFAVCLLKRGGGNESFHALKSRIQKFFWKTI